MKYVIDDTTAHNIGLTLPQALMLAFINTGENIQWVLAELMDKGIITQFPHASDKKYEITNNWKPVCERFLVDSEKIPTEKELYPLAEKLRNLFPPGLKPGTSNHWKCQTHEVAVKLQKFYKIYGMNYTEEQIIDATRRYVDSFHGDYRYMRILKYFIWKKENEEGIVSALANFLDNAGQEDVDDNSWVNELR